MQLGVEGQQEPEVHERKVNRKIGMPADSSSASRLTASFEYVGPALGWES